MQGNWAYIVIAICILLAIGFAWQEYRRDNKRFLLWRIAAVIIAAAALACIILPITYGSSITQTDKHKTILLTENFDADSLNNPDAVILTTDAAVKKEYPRAKLISGLEEIDRNAQLHIYGQGLSRAALQQLDSLPIVFHPAKTPAGITHISWNEKLKAGETLHIQGQYNNTSAQKTKLVLKGLNTGLDSVIIPPNAQTAFSLSTIPKTTGKAIFELQAGGTIQGSIPVQIEAVKPLKVLILSASPDFEARFLKNWLGENGYPVAVRSAISKDKFNTEFINIDQLNLNNLSLNLLNKFDVLIGDLSVLNSLDPAESANLKQENTGKGLGLIVRADSTGKSSWLQGDFPVDRPSGKEPAPASLIINEKKSTSGKLNYGLAHISYRNGTQPLVKTGQGRILVSSTISGSGKIIFTTLNTTFSWMLGGNKADYSALWSALISKAARKTDTVQSGLTFLSPPYANEPAQLQITQAKASPITINNQSISPAQNPNVPFEWDAQYWPSAGWQNMKQGDKTSAWYTYSQQDWKAARAVDNISATKKYAEAHTITEIVTKQIQQKIRIDVPKIYFYILLLAACTFLWIETKFS